MPAWTARSWSAVPDPGVSAGEPLDAPALDALFENIGQWLMELGEDNPAMAGVEPGAPDLRQWYVRLAGEAKDHFSVLLTLGQRTMHVESYFMPAPEENLAEVYAYLLRKSKGLLHLAFVLGDHNGVYLDGHVPNDRVTQGEVDRIIGSVWTETEACFVPAMRLGYESRFHR